MLIGLHGKLGCGKNTVASIARELFIGKSEEVAFAAKLKQSAAALLRVSVRDIEDFKNDPDVTVQFCVSRDGEEGCLSQLTVREFLQRYGTESHRDIFGQDFWVNQALPDSDIYQMRDRLFLVTDLRFENEARKIRSLGGLNIRIQRPETDEKVGTPHLSEKPLDPSLIDYTVNNTGTMSELRAEVDRMLAWSRVALFYGKA